MESLQKPLIEDVAQLCKEKNIDVIVLAESEIAPTELKVALTKKREPNILYHIALLNGFSSTRDTQPHSLLQFTTAT